MEHQDKFQIVRQSLASHKLRPLLGPVDSGTVQLVLRTGEKGQYRLVGRIQDYITDLDHNPDTSTNLLGDIEQVGTSLCLCSSVSLSSVCW